MEELTMAEFFAKFEAIWQALWTYLYKVFEYVEKN